jgi:hypothetical protein
LALVRIGSSSKFYINGVATTYSNSTVIQNVNLSFWIGKHDNTPGSGGGIYRQSVNGLISNIRVVKGVGVYTGNFAVPTSVLTTTQSAGTNINAITGTQTSLLTYTTTAATIVGGVPTYFSKVSTGSLMTGAIRSDGLLFTWGSGVNFNLGNNSAISRSSPVQVGPVGIGAPNTSYTSVNTGYFYSGAIGTNGLLYMWGLNTGQTNFPSIWYNGLTRSNPTQIDGLYATTAAATRVPIRSGSSSWTMVEAGNSFSSGLYYRTAGVNGLLYTWGLNSIGQLGLNDTINRSSPVQIGQNTFLSTTVGTSNTGAIGKAT